MFNSGNFSGGGKPPDFTKAKETGKKFARRALGPILLVIALLIVGFNCAFSLNAGEEAVITRFGHYTKTIKSSGLQFILPFVEKAEIVNVEGIRRQEFGFRSQQANYLNASPLVSEEFIEAESLMITGDQNLVNADWAILYKVSNSYDFLFKVQHAEDTFRIIAESAYRRVVASHSLDDVLTDKKDEIQREIMSDLQAICDKYEMGVIITGVQLQDAMPPDPVRPSFLDVSAAREERQSRINEAQKYENEQLPIARGEAVGQVNDAEGYKEKRINEAEGMVARYKSIEKEYAAQPDIMRTRLYLEMIRDVLPRIQNVYFVNDAGDMVKFLPLGPSSVIPEP